MNQDPVRVYQVHWTRVFPFLRLFQAGSLGLGLSTFVLAAACLVVSWTGSVLLHHLIADSVSGDSIGFASSVAGQSPLAQSPLEYGQTRYLFPPPISGLRSAAVDIFFSGQFFTLSSGTIIPPQHGSLLLSSLQLAWNALVLGLFGTAMARSVATEFCQHSRSGVVVSLRYAIRHWPSTLLATGLTIAFPAVLKLLLSLAGLLPNLGVAGQWFAAAVWGFLFLLAIVLAMMFIVGGLAWLLSLSAVGTDGCTGAEALSRCISYVLSHPLWVSCAVVVISLTGLVVRWVVELALFLGVAALPASLWNPVHKVMPNQWLHVVNLVPHAFQLAVFAAGVTVCYVLLRQREDGITTEELDGAM